MNIRIIQKKDVTYKNGASPLYLRFTHNRQNKLVSLGVAVSPDHWDNKKQVIAVNCPDCRELQRRVDNQLDEYKKKINRLEALEMEVDFDTLFEARLATNKLNIKEYFTHIISQLKEEDKLNTASKYYFTLSSLCKFRSMEISFESIDVSFLESFERYLRKSGNKSNSIATKFSVLKAVYNKAILNKIFILKENPFVHYKIGELWEETRKRAITKESIHELINHPLPQTSSPYLEFARDVFIFSYFIAGINFKDMATLRYCDIINDRVYYKRHKTGKEINCILSPIAKAILIKYQQSQHEEMDYIFPILNKQVHITEQQIFNRIHKALRKINISLRKWSELLKTNFNLTTYVARHTYATVLKKSGVNVALISESLGHSDLKTTQIYLDSFENTQIDEAMSNLL